ncbi:MAG: hypothetical protein ACTSU5_17285 [Promethearchaeota archaeon]
MNRKLLEEVLALMAEALKEGKDIGNLKIGALFALGSQLEAIFYFCGHELASILEVDRASPSDMDKIVEILEKVTDTYNLGKFHAKEVKDRSLVFQLEDCGSCRNLKGITSKSSFCSFEAGLYAGLVEKITGGEHCFAQEIASGCEGGGSEFMVVIQ